MVYFYAPGFLCTIKPTLFTYECVSFTQPLSFCAAPRCYFRPIFRAEALFTSIVIAGSTRSTTENSSGLTPVYLREPFYPGLTAMRTPPLPAPLILRSLVVWIDAVGVLAGGDQRCSCRNRALHEYVCHSFRSSSSRISVGRHAKGTRSLPLPAALGLNHLNRFVILTNELRCDGIRLGAVCGIRQEVSPVPIIHSLRRDGHVPFLSFYYKRLGAECQIGTPCFAVCSYFRFVLQAKSIHGVFFLCKLCSIQV